MLTIHKHVLPQFIDTVTINFPRGTELLTVAEQHEAMCLWVRFDDTVTAMVPVKLNIRGTGHPDCTGRYIGTVLLEAGAYVLHVFVQEEGFTLC